MQTAAAAFALLTFVGCGTGRQSYATDTDLKRWDCGAELLLPNIDTTTLRDISIFIYHTDDFREDSLSLRITTTTPDSLYHREELLFVPHHRRNAVGVSCEDVVTYRREVVFDRQGDYKITITPLRPVKGVAAVGIQLSKSE